MNRNCVRLLSRLSTSFSKQYTLMSSYSYFSVKKLTEKLHHCCYSRDSKDLYAVLNEDDFENIDQQSSYADVDFETMANGDTELLKTLKLCQLEIDLMAQEGGNVPDVITTTQWLELACLITKTQRSKFIQRLWRKQARKLAPKFKIERDNSLMKRYREKTILSTNSPVEYGLQNTTLFHRIYEPDMKNLYNFRLLQAMMYGPHIVVDCGFEKYMTSRDLTITTKQILDMWSHNREHFYPYDILFCNFNVGSTLYSRLCGVLPAIEQDPACPFNFTDKNYLDLFPKDKLIYLTPDCKEIMEEYEHDCVYILGGLSDRSHSQPITMAKAKRDGLRMAKFPLDKYMDWDYGTRNLDINACLTILSDLRDGRDWKFACRHILHSSLPSSKSALLDEGYEQEKETNTKTSEHVKEQMRRKTIYDMLLDRRPAKK